MSFYNRHDGMDAVESGRNDARAIEIEWVSDRFRRFAAWTADRMGSAWAFVAAVALVMVWAASGPAVGYSDSWELVINTVTTILTFLMVFLIQNAQNREAKATQLKLNELIRAVGGARTGLVGLEHLDDSELGKLEEQFAALRAKALPAGVRDKTRT